MSEAGVKHGEIYKDLESLSNIRQPSGNIKKLDTDSELAERAQTSRANMAKIEYITEKLEEKQDSKTERQLELGDTTINKVYSELKREQDRKDLEEKISAGEQLTEKEILDKLGSPPRPYDVWNFKLDQDFGKEYDGRIPAGIVFNTLYFFTKPGDIVVDPMAGEAKSKDDCIP